MADKPSDPPISKDSFAETMMDAIKTAGETTGIRYESDEFRIVTEEMSHILNLGNAYHEFCSASVEKRDNVIRRFVRTWFSHYKDVPKDFEDASPDLLPAIRNRSYFELTTLDLRVQGMNISPFPMRIIGEHFAAGLVYDLPEAIHLIQPTTLTEWNVTFAHVFEIALKNLADISQNDLDELTPGVWASPWNDNHDASRLLLPNLIRHHKVQGDPVVMVPNRDTLLLTGSEDIDGLSAVLSMTEEALESPRPFNGIALRLKGEEWVPFLPSPDHPDFGEFQLMWVRAFAQDYDEQKGLLEALYEKASDDVFIAGYTGMQNKETGSIWSYCVWSKDVDTMLPKADLVNFFVQKDEDDDGEIVATAEWDRVVEVAGELMVPQGMYPERYRVAGFPTDEQLAALQSE